MQWVQTHLWHTVKSSGRRGCGASSHSGNCTALETRYWTYSHPFAVSRLMSSSAVRLASFCALLFERAWLASVLNEAVASVK